MKKEKMPFSFPLGEKKRVAIIGGGATGALLSFELARQGHDVVLIEAGMIGHGSSSRSAACIRQQFGTPSTVRGMIFARRYYDYWDSFFGKVKPIVHSGYLFLKNWTSDLVKIEQTVKMQRDAGLKEVEILSVESVNKLFPYIDTIGITCATWCPSDGFLFPDKVFTDAVEGAKEYGATIILNDEVVSAQCAGDACVSVKTKSGRIISSDYFVNAAGVWAPNISSILGGFEIDIKARKRYLYFMDGFDSDSLKTDQVMTESHLKNLPMIITPEGSYCRPESQGSGRIMAGWLQFENSVNPSFETQDIIEKGFGIHDYNDYGWAVRKSLMTHIPDINNMGPLYSVTSGFYEDTPDHNPLIGFDPIMKNLIHCAGFSGHGLMHAPFSAFVVSNLLSAGRDLDNISLPFDLGEVDLKPFSVSRVFQSGEAMVI